MTKEEAINVMRKYTDTESGIGKVVAEAHEVAIKALEQEPKTDILDKIRAEIEEASTYDGIYIDRAYVLEILDKYKAEVEPQESEDKE